MDNMPTRVRMLERKLDNLRNKKDKCAFGRRQVDVLNELVSELFNPNPQKAELYASEALALAKDIRYIEGLARSQNCMAKVKMKNSKYKEALELDMEALKEYRNINHIDGMAAVCSDMGIIYDQLGRFNESIQYSRKAQKYWRKTKKYKGIAFAYNNIGNTYIHQGRYRSALNSYQKAARIFKRIDDKYHYATATVNMGNANERLGKYDEALKCCFKALKLRQEICDEVETAAEHHTIGIIYVNKGEYTTALQHCLYALKLWESINHIYGMIHAMGVIGGIYYDQGEYDEALKYYLGALKNSEAIGDKYHAANNATGVAEVYKKHGAYGKALRYVLKALKAFEEVNSNAGIKHCYSIIGSIHEEQHRLKKALAYYLESSRINRKIGDREGMASAYMRIAGVQIKLKNWDAALSHAKRGLRIAKAIAHKEAMLRGYEVIYQFYEVKGEYREALKYHHKYVNLEKEMFGVEKNKQIAEIRTKYEIDRKEKEAEIHRLKNVKLRKEIAKRRKVERELSKHRDQLEELVEKRTVELKKELTKRQRAEKELLKRESQLIALNRALSMVEEKQRRKTAGYLHDNISQALSLAIFKIRGLQESGTAKSIRKELAQIKEIVAQTNQRTRTLTFEISPPVLYELGLEPAIEWLVGQFQTQHSITCSFKNDDSSKPLKDEARIFLFQAVRELLNNVSKHARAQAVRVSAFKDDNTICISVEDDGVGFDPASLDHKIIHNEGFGLFNIRERLRYIGGKLEVNSESGKGTSVVLIAPLKSRSTRTSRKRL